MTNNQNLKPIRSKKEAREKGKKGGEKSGEVRRERKALREELLILLTTGQNQEKISLALLDQALAGNIKAFETIRDTIGEKPTEKREIYNNDLNLPIILVKDRDLADPKELLDKIRIYKNAKICYITQEEEIEIDEHIQQVINGEL